VDEQNCLSLQAVLAAGCSGSVRCWLSCCCLVSKHAINILSVLSVCMSFMQVLKRSGTEQEKKHARRIMPVSQSMLQGQQV
jgi:hypothetical protein